MESKRRRQPGFSVKIPLTQSWSASTRAFPAGGSGHPVHYLLVCDEGEARDKQVELLLSALYQNGRIRSQRYTCMDFDSDEGVDESLLETLYSASTGGTMVLSYTPKAAGGGSFASGIWM